MTAIHRKAHPNEPIGSMMLHHLTHELVENQALRDYFDFTWHIVICAEPDKAKLEGLEFRKEVFRFVLRNYEDARPMLTASSLFVDLQVSWRDQQNSDAHGGRAGQGGGHGLYR